MLGHPCRALCLVLAPPAGLMKLVLHLRVVYVALLGRSTCDKNFEEVDVNKVS